MNKQPHIKSYRAVLGTICTTALLMGVSGSSVLAEVPGDGWLGPQVFTGAVLDRSLHILNHQIQDKYDQETLLAGLSQPRTPDFAEAALASAAIPVIEETQETGAFGYLVSDDSSLNNGLDLFNTEVALRGNDLFIRVALEATSKGEAFSMAAAGAVVDEQIQEYRLELAGVREGFGDQVRNGPSLQASVVALNQRIFDLEQREDRLAAAVPAVDGASFDNVMVAMAISF
ncbi:hypothetical protein [Sedimenticola sp.]|uniref:hypothetical protein n=1 Tax=Sedimenticola sp. TaxID=1940285 RepID=UPI003D0C7505